MFRCEYCLPHERDAAFPHEVDHIISRQHGGETTADNLAYACLVCNRYKGSNVASISRSGNLVALFNPRMDKWSHHFRLNGAFIEPLDLVGEVTARLLRLNTPERLMRRSLLQQLRRYPKE
jgi:HNH endonuclease